MRVKATADLCWNLASTKFLKAVDPIEKKKYWYEAFKIGRFLKDDQGY